MNTIEKIMELNLSDFDMIVDGLEALKTKDFAGEMLGMFTDSFGAPNDPNERKKWLEERDKKRKSENEEKERKRKAMCEDIDVVRSKLVIMREAMKLNIHVDTAKKLE